PRRALTAFSISSLPSGRLPVSCSRRPTSVDLPWSTWPTMTMRTCGRVVPFGVAETLAGRIMFIGAALLGNRSEIAGDAEPLEGIFGFVIERAAGAFRHLGAVELGQDLVDIRRGRCDRIGDVLVAQRAITLAVFCKIKRDDRNVFTLGVSPDVGLGPMQDRMNA